MAVEKNELALVELAAALGELTRGIEKMLIVQKVKLKHLESSVNEMLDGAKNIHEYQQWHNEHGNDVEQEDKNG